MTIILLLIPLSVVIAVVFLVAFVWAVRSGQYEDTYTPSLRLLWRDQPVLPSKPDAPKTISLKAEIHSAATASERAQPESSNHQ